MKNQRNKKRKIIKLSSFLIIILLLSSCGSQRKNFVAKTWHNVNSFFNGYYNARVLYKDAVRQKDQEFDLIPGQLLQIFPKPETDKKTKGGDFDVSIEKCETVINKHPNSRWVDDCYLLIAKNWFQKGEFYVTVEFLEFIEKTYPNSKLMPEIYLWLAKSHIFADDYDMGLKILDEKLKHSSVLKKKLRGEKAMMFAYFAIAKEEYKEAIKIIETDIKNVKNKDTRARAYFLLGQLYARENNYETAFNNFQRVIKLNRSYELTFNAKLYQARLFDPNTKNDEIYAKIQKSLKKLLRDEKNYEFRDQIYYEYALLELKRNDMNKALEYLQLSLNTSVKNKRQKALSYYQTGKIYFYHQQKYLKAAAYYDSAAVVITKDAPEYDEIKIMASSLKEYTTHYYLVEKNDSLLYLASLPPSQLDAKIEKEMEEDQKRQEELMKQQEALFNNDLFNAENNETKGKSTFYFDNPTQVNQGKQDFQQQWGIRKNEDNWRRSNKQVVFNNLKEDEEIPDSLKEKYGNKAKYYAKIPFLESQQEALKEQIMHSLFKLGQIYGKQLNMPEEAIQSYKRLIKEYPETNYMPASYYALYRLHYDEIKDYAEAKVYKDLLINKFPTSKYAKLILNPNQSKFDEKNDSEYESAFAALKTVYDTKSYAECLTMSNFMAQKFKDNEDIARVYYLKGMAFAGLNKKDSLLSVFQFVQKTYPDHEVIPYILATLKKQNGTSSNNGSGNTKLNNLGDISLNNNSKYKIVKNKNEQVWVLLLIDKNKVKSSDLKIKLTKFLSDYYAKSSIQKRVLVYQNQHLGILSPFNNFADALKAVKTLQNAGNLSGLFKNPNRDIFFITPTNFKTAFTGKDMKAYVDFYVKNRSTILNKN